MRAMILAAGLGTRMRPLTNDCPKPLLPVAGKPMIEYQIERLADIGVEQLVINVSYRAEQIEQALGDGGRWGLCIHYSHEPEALETAGGIIQALEWLDDGEDGPFLLLNGDVWCDLPLDRLPKQFDGKGLLLLVDNPEHNPNGDFVVQQGRVVEPTDSSWSRLTFAGISRLRPSLFEGLVPGKRALGPLLHQAAAEGNLAAQYYPGYWLDVGTPERLQRLDHRLRTTTDKQDGTGE
ncbi:nucleotidyltransferase family protein [Motiliproteus coralliicola]|uniref:Nucleotidyltransferase family protein n=1 Tax=Motiliproteus coralliicola TaxID=2283196 RepID=A0A369WGP5_9GAMM|nr:nucleotidyltransferase family protein [Motiliproteus coralliicola]RDE19864.1 nucleotidyltransferase family protein [Motiliproteus coralliicola]